ncbi:FadR/GntR family transcriptional regulator [Microbacterium sp.]|uniref:FadR/GntR family transcriptional regulator n=1 Tax=Microbacterium sp. TaxID=51671 RepID=UPI003F7068C4
MLAQDSSLLSDYFGIELRRDPRGLLELLDIRRSLETLSVSDAAAASTPAAVAALTAPIDRMAADVEQLRHGDDVGEAFHQADLDFHAALSLISGNRMLARLIDGLTQSLHDSFLVSAQGHALRGHGAEEVVAAHRAIADAVAAGDRARAKAAMLSHLDETERDLLAVLSATPEHASNRKDEQ